MRYFATACLLGGLLVLGYGCFAFLHVSDIRFDKSNEGRDTFGPLWTILFGLCLSAWGAFELKARSGNDSP